MMLGELAQKVVGVFLEAISTMGQLAITLLYMEMTVNHINISHLTQTECISISHFTLDLKSACISGHKEKLPWKEIEVFMDCG